MPEQASRQPVRQEWPGFLAVIAEAEQGNPVSIEVMGQAGNEPEAVAVPLAEFSYSEREDAVIVAVDGGSDGPHRHVVIHPWKIQFDPPSPFTARTIDIEGPDGAHTLVTLHNRPMPSRS
ncbi:MAG TPA: DUF5335 family protein [Acidimicrobiia bacterium]|nr:DUF5335 family protein [Acidimicrobiia bacterium]